MNFEAKPPGLCRRCESWEPLFTGEAWGVRSFVDAPPEVQEAIKARLEAQIEADGWADAYGALGNDYPCSTDGVDHSVPGGSDWPEWGECNRTDLHGNEPSLARAIDGSHYRAVLRCHANFGCIQYQELQPD